MPSHLRGSTVLLLLAAACVQPKAVGDSPLDTSTDDGSESGSASSDADADSSSDASSGGDTLCPPNPNFTCEVPPPDCEFGGCGMPTSEFDANGCLRPRCDDDTPCPDGLFCLALGPAGSCAASTTICDDANGTDVCSCGGTADCSYDGSLCVEPELAFPTACGQLEDEASCLAAGCPLWVDSASPGFVGTASCTCESIGGNCLWWEEGVVPPSTEEQTIYYRHDGTYRLFYETWSIPPAGWLVCQPDDEITDACDCDPDSPLCI